MVVSKCSKETFFEKSHGFQNSPQHTCTVMITAHAQRPNATVQLTNHSPIP